MFKDDLTNDCNCKPQQVPTCESRVIDPTTLGECDNRCYKPFGRPGPLVVKTPVVLSDVKIQIDMESDIRLEQPAFDIKTIDKHVCITQCHLVPYTNKLFIGGYVQKNIQYSTVECANATSISGDVRHTTVNVPFRCVTPIHFDRKPEFGKTLKIRSNSLDENMLCINNNEDSWVHFNKFNEPIFCELEWAKILETDIFNRNIDCAENFTDENCFRRLTEKMVVYIRIKVLQNQQVFISKPHCEMKMIENYDEDYDEEEYDDYEDVEVGYSNKDGMIGRMLKKEKYY